MRGEYCKKVQGYNNTIKNEESVREKRLYYVPEWHRDKPDIDLAQAR